MDRDSSSSWSADADADSGEAFEAAQLAIDALDPEVPRVQVVRLRPGPWFWWVLPLLFLAAGAIGYSLAGDAEPVVSSDERLAEMRDGYEQDRVDELRAELTELRLAQNVDAPASNDVRARFRELQEEIAALEEEVSFYRSLMAPEALAKGLYIENMRLNTTERPGVFGYDLVIAQTEARHAWQEGAVYFEVHGAVDGDRSVLALTEIATIPEYPLNFKFRYFQNYSGELTLPEDFSPETVIVTLDRGDSGEVVQRRYDWTTKGA